jgi:death-on-curing protein
VQYLSAEDILVIHDETIEKEGGIFGIRDIGLVYSIAERPKMAMMGQEFYPDVFSKATAILEGLATFHVFADGNKRTAFIACLTFLGLNEYELEVSTEQGLIFVLAVTTKKKTLEEIANWLKKHSRKI